MTTPPRISWSAPQIVGWSRWAPEQILNQAAAEHSTRGIPGDFTVTGKRKQDDADIEIIASSGVAAMPYYYTHSPRGAVVHGASVFDVTHRAALGWRWSQQALIDLAIFGHTLGDDTLHPDVRRFPNDMVAVIHRHSMRMYKGSQWRRIFVNHGTGSLDQAARCFESAASDLLVGEEPLVSLSGGFDSRVLLASVLAAGARPTLLTMGYPDSSDRIIASQIAHSLGLDHRIVELDPRDYLDAGPLVTSITGGVKTSAHWHSYLYPRAAADITGPHLVGSNGEFARTFYVNHGPPSRLLDRTAYPGLYCQWVARIARRIRTASRLGLIPESRFRAVGRAAGRVAHLSGHATHVLDALDRFYSTQRVRHFIGNGLALYAASGRPRSPFLDWRWIEAAAALPREDKLEARHHRDLLHRLYPALSRFPLGDEACVVRSPRPAAWLRSSTRLSVGYSPLAEVLELREAKDRMVDCPGLDAVIPRRLRERALVDGDATAKDLLLTLSFVVEAGPTVQ